MLALDEHTRTIAWHDAEAARSRLAGKTGI